MLGFLEGAAHIPRPPTSCLLLLPGLRWIRFGGPANPKYSFFSKKPKVYISRSHGSLQQPAKQSLLLVCRGDCLLRPLPLCEGSCRLWVRRLSIQPSRSTKQVFCQVRCQVCKKKPAVPTRKPGDTYHVYNKFSKWPCTCLNQRLPRGRLL